MNHSSILALSAVPMVVSAFAESTESYDTTTKANLPINLAAIFEPSDSLQFAILSEQE